MLRSFHVFFFVHDECCTTTDSLVAAAVGLSSTCMAAMRPFFAATPSAIDAQVARVHPSLIAPPNTNVLLFRMHLRATDLLFKAPTKLIVVAANVVLVMSAAKKWRHARRARESERERTLVVVST